MEQSTDKKILNIVYPKTFFDNCNKAGEYWENRLDETCNTRCFLRGLLCHLFFLGITIVAAIDVFIQLVIVIIYVSGFTVPLSMNKAILFALIGLVVVSCGGTIDDKCQKHLNKGYEDLCNEAHKYKWTFSSSSVYSSVYNNYSFLEDFIKNGVKTVSIKLDIDSGNYIIQVEDPDKTGSRSFGCDNLDILNTADFSFLDSLKLYPENNTA